METASTIIRDALQEILVQASEQPIQSNEATDAMRYLNRMMAQWEAMGIALGYTPVTSLGDDITVPVAALDGIVLNLSLKLAPQYDVAITGIQAQNARDALAAIRAITISVGPAYFPSTLPIGSGNEQYGWQNTHFYPSEESNILGETTGQIVQETSNND